MKCPVCGRTNPATEEFCEYCGAELKATAAVGAAASAANSPNKPPLLHLPM